MTETLTIPPWVPAGVRLMYEVGSLKNDCARRLLTDARMKPAWTELRKLVPTTDTPAPRYHPPSSYMQERMKFIAHGCDLHDWDLDRDLTDFDRLSAALYYKVVCTLSQVEAPLTWTIPEAEAEAKPFFDAAKICDYEINSPWLIREDLIAALEIVRDHLLNQGEMRRMSNNPRVLDRHSKKDSDELRAQVRSVAVEVRDLFGPFATNFPNAAAGRIAVVSLDKANAINKAFRNTLATWCKDLPAPVSIPA